MDKNPFLERPSTHPRQDIFGAYAAYGPAAGLSLPGTLPAAGGYGMLRPAPYGMPGYGGLAYAGAYAQYGMVRSSDLFCVNKIMLLHGLKTLSEMRTLLTLR